MIIGIYGLGRFGSFWGGILGKQFKVKGWSRSQKNNVPDSIEITTEDEVLSCDAIFFCVSISAFQDVLKRTASKIAEGTLVFDTCSVKMQPIGWMEDLLPERVEILGTHPMFGPDSGAGGVEGLPIALCPARVSGERLNRWRGIFEDMGLRVLQMTADEHDHQAAYSQGITHFIGRVINDLELSEYPISTLGFKKMMDVAAQTCNDPFQLFLDLQRFNPYTGEMRKKLHGSLQKMLDILDEQ
jgi:prephenate dehydrogenase